MNLSPQQAVDFAIAPYRVNTHFSTGGAAIPVREILQGDNPIPGSGKPSWNDRIGHVVNIDWAEVLSGRSGSGVGKESTFCVLFPHNARDTDWVVAFRGTQSGADWASNLQLSEATGPAGLPVHSGFQKIFESLEEGIMKRLGTISGTIHCVGHSLGGALANLMATSLSSAGVDTRLYTFGCPRVGRNAFAQYTTTKVGAEHIFRVQNIFDPVPMVPWYDFMHAPASERGILIARGSSNFNDYGHSADEIYRPAIADSTWRALRGGGPSFLQLTEATGIDNLLKIASDQPTGSVYSHFILRRILNNLLELIAKQIPIVATGIVSVIDQIAYVLHHAARALEAIEERLRKWVELALRAVGKAHMIASGAVSLTATFLRWLLEMLARPIVAMASRALRALS